MTTVVVVRKGNNACIAADTLTSFGSTKYGASCKTDPDKIFRVGDSYFGIVGSSAHRMVLESALTTGIEPPRLTGRREVFEAFRALHPRLKEQYFLNPKEDDKDPYESSQMDIIANPYGLFGLMTLRETYEFSRFWAIGSGSDWPLGALHAIYDQDLARQLAVRAVEVAVEFDKSSGGPVTACAFPLATR
jgi:ATP-dependent protease HslVU (ClpYQ) peptidase subunit